MAQAHLRISSTQGLQFDRFTLKQRVLYRLSCDFLTLHHTGEEACVLAHRIDLSLISEYLLPHSPEVVKDWLEKSHVSNLT